MVRTAAHLVVPVIASRASAMLSVKHRALLLWPAVMSASPPDSRAGSQAHPPEQKRGGRAQRKCGRQHAPSMLPADEVGAMPHGTEICSGVGRAARRARLAAKPF